MTKTLTDLFSITPAELEELLPGGGSRSKRDGGLRGALRKAWSKLVNEGLGKGRSGRNAVGGEIDVWSQPVCSYEVAILVKVEFL